MGRSSVCCYFLFLLIKTSFVIAVNLSIAGQNSGK